MTNQTTQPPVEGLLEVDAIEKTGRMEAFELPDAQEAIDYSEAERTQPDVSL